MKILFKLPYLLMLFANFLFSQSYYEWDSYSVDEFYQKVDLDYGTLDQDGNEIDFIFVITELDEGIYEVEISDENNELYTINGTDYYIKFTSYYGYAGYGEEGILEVSSGGYSTFYKKEE